MSLQLFSGPPWEEDSFNEINAESISLNAAEMAGDIGNLEFERLPNIDVAREKGERQ